MDSFHYSSIKLFTVFLPLFCLLSWSWGAASTAVPLLPPRSSATLAADTLRSRGYSIFASLLVSMSATTNFSGTLLAPPDFVFSFASAKFLNNHHPPPRPSIPLLFYHTLSPPLILTWPALSTRDDGDELRTFYNRNCLFLLRSSFGEVSISSSPFKNPIAAVKISQPDLYVDEHLAVHGIDGILDPSFATKCSVPYIEPSADAVSLQVSRVFLDRAMRGLWRKGYNVVAAAMAIRRSELLSLTSTTVFAVSDEHLFMKPGGFRYDFRHHVVPMRLRFADFEKLAVGGMELFTLASNKTVVVKSVDGAVKVDGVAMSMTEVYHNRWIVVVSIASSLDDVIDSQLNPSITGDGDLPRVPSSAPSYTEDSQRNAPTTDAVSDNWVPSPAPAFTEGSRGNTPAPSPSPFSGLDRVPSPAPPFTEGSRGNQPIPSVSRKGIFHRVPSQAPSYIEETENGVPSLAPANVPTVSTDFDSVGTPSPAPELNEGIGDNAPSIGSPSSSPSPSPEIEVAENPVSSPTPSPATDDVSDAHCRSNGVEGGDLLCPVRAVRQLRDYVELSRPSDGHSQDAYDLTQFYKAKIAENVNIADDVFFYI